MGMSTYQELTDRALEYINSGNWEDAYEMLKQKETANDKDAIAVLASFYLLGIGVAKDGERAVELFNKAIEMGSADAAFELGFVYYDNDAGIPLNRYKMVELLEKGAQGGHEGCFAALSSIYLNGDGVPADHQKAFQYAMLAAKAGHSTGMLNAAVCYEDGIGTGADPYAASHWYKEYLNYEPNEVFVMTRIAICLADPGERFRNRPTGEMLNEAFYYASKAVEAGDVEAHFVIGWFYEKGEIVQQNYELAHKYIEIAADNGSEGAREYLKRFKKNIFGQYYV